MFKQPKNVLLAFGLIVLLFGGFTLVNYTALLQQKAANIRLQQEVDKLKSASNPPQVDTHNQLQQRPAKGKVTKEDAALALSKIRTKHDDMRGVTWYEAKTTPDVVDTKNISLYIAKMKDGTLRLFLKVTYEADEWLWIKGYMLQIDGETYELPARTALERDSTSNGIWEKSDEELYAQDMPIIRALAKAHTVKMRYIGEHQYVDRIVTPAEIAAFGDVLTVYKSMGGNL